jgi:hypothetical protein
MVELTGKLWLASETPLCAPPFSSSSALSEISCSASVRARSCSSPIETCDGIAANHGAVQFQTACDSDKGSQPRGDLVPIVPACESDTFTGWRLFDAGRRSPGIARSSSFTRTTDRSKKGHETGQAWGTGGTRMIWYYSRLHAHAAGLKGELSPRVTWTDPKGIQRDRRKWEARGRQNSHRKAKRGGSQTNQTTS